MYAASGDARNATASATSSAVPSLFMGMRSATPALKIATCGALKPAFEKIGVAM